MSSLRNQRPRTAVVTGATGTLGRAAALSLARSGHSLVLMARNQKRLLDARAEIIHSNPEAVVETAAVDLNEPERVSEFCEIYFGDSIPFPDILVYTTRGPDLHIAGTEPIDEMRQMINSHSLSLIAMMQFLAPRMEARGWGRILSIMSRTIVEPTGDNPISAAARLPAWAVMKSYVRSGRFPRVTFNAVLAGIFDSPRYDAVVEEMAQQQGKTTKAIRRTILDGVSAGRPGLPEELGALCNFLASDEADYVNGQRVLIDGGSTRGL